MDVTAILDPDVGVVRWMNQSRSSISGLPVWTVGTGLACGHPEPAGADEMARCVTGACAPSRTEAVIRAVGEAVERYALHGPPDLQARMSEVPGPVLQMREPGAELADPPTDRVIGWYRSTRLSDGATVLAPSGVVEYPGTDLPPGFDPGPSGAAAGVGSDAALRSALLETVERDAIIVAWARQLRLQEVDVDRVLVAATADERWQRLADSVALVREAGLQPVFARVPCGVPGVVCVVGGLDGPPGQPRIALGAKASEHPADALRAALHESMQLYPALGTVAPAGDPMVSTELDRMRFLASSAGQAALRQWLADPEPHEYPTVQGPSRSTQALLADLMADGLDPHLVDLSGRLPPRLRDRGWAVVKVIPVGYQPLRIDERTEYGWNHRRLDEAEWRTGAVARLPVGTRVGAPHPLP